MVGKNDRGRTLYSSEDHKPAFTPGTRVRHKDSAQEMTTRDGAVEPGHQLCCWVDDQGQQHSAEFPANILEVSMSPDDANTFSTLENKVIWLHAKWAIYRQLYGTDEETVNLLNESACGFFGMYQSVLLDEVLLTLARLTDPVEQGKYENLTLEHLVQLAETRADRRLLPDVRALLAEVVTKCEPFRRHRMKRIAHTDLPTALKVVQNPLPDLSREMIEDALRSLRRLMLALRTGFGKDEMVYDRFTPTGDGKALLWCLRAAKAYRKHQLDGLVKPWEDGVL
jgi:AbiU2